MLFTHKGFSGPAVLDLSHFLIKAGFNKQQTKEMGGAEEPEKGGPLSSIADAVVSVTTASRSAGDRPPQPPGRESAGLFVNWTGEPGEVWEERLKVRMR